MKLACSREHPLPHFTIAFGLSDALVHFTSELVVDLVHLAAVEGNPLDASFLFERATMRSQVTIRY